MFNLVVLTGRLTADPELKTTPNGISVTRFSIAVQRRQKNADGEYGTDFINIVAWRQTAEFIAHFFTKGSLIGIEGSIQTRKYPDRDGNNRTKFEVVANNAQFVSAKSDDKNNEPETTDNNEAPDEDFTEVDSDNDLPF